MTDEERLAAAEQAKLEIERQARAAVDAGDVTTLEGLSRRYFATIAIIKSLTDVHYDNGTRP